MSDFEPTLETLLPDYAREVDDLPLKVVPDWDDQFRRAETLCRLVDRHLDAEARGRILQDPRSFRPEHLCPEQRVQMATDLYGATHQEASS